MDAHFDVGVVELAEGFDFDFKAGAEARPVGQLARQYLHRHQPVGAFLGGGEHRAHGSFAELSGHVIRPEL